MTEATALKALLLPAPRHLMLLSQPPHSIKLNAASACRLVLPIALPDTDEEADAAPIAPAAVSSSTCVLASHAEVMRDALTAYFDSVDLASSHSPPLSRTVGYSRCPHVFVGGIAPPRTPARKYTRTLKRAHTRIYPPLAPPPFASPLVQHASPALPRCCPWIPPPPPPPRVAPSGAPPPPPPPAHYKFVQYMLKPYRPACLSPHVSRLSTFRSRSFP